MIGIKDLFVCDRFILNWLRALLSIVIPVDIYHIPKAIIKRKLGKHDVFIAITKTVEQWLVHLFTLELN